LTIQLSLTDAFDYLYLSTQGGRGAGAAGPAQSMRKTRLCEEFMQTGRCKYGDRCTYAHGQHELRPPPTAGMQGERREVGGWVGLASGIGKRWQEEWLRFQTTSVHVLKLAQCNLMVCSQAGCIVSRISQDRMRRSNCH
jgi:hypothetical protein